MTTETLLQKLRPLLPKRVRQWERQLDFATPDVRRLLEHQIMRAAHKHLGDYRRKLLLSLPPERTAQGTLHLGTVVYDTERWPAGITHAEVVQNLAIFGRSGAGKTNVAFHLLEQLVRQRVPFVFLDWKRTARHLLPRLTRKVHVYTPGRPLAPFPFNPFAPPPGLESSVYTGLVIDVLADAYTLGDGARHVLHQAITTCYANTKTPLPADVLRAVHAIPDKERVRGWKISAIRALESLTGIALATTGQDAMVETLLRQHTIIELDGLAPSAKKFFLPLLCLWMYYVALPLGEREQLKLVVFVEEAHHVLFDHKGTKESIMHMLLRQCREIGISMIIIDQHPHLVSSVTLGNTYTSICLNLKDPKDVKKAGELSLIPSEDRSHLSRLPVGQGVIKLQDRWHQPFLVRFPLVPVQKGAVTDSLLAAFVRRDITLLGLRRRVNAANEQPRLNRPLTPATLRFITDILTHPTDGVNTRYHRLNLTTDKGNQQKQHLLQTGIIEEQLIPIGKTRRLLLRVTTPAARDLGLTTTHTGNESLAHTYWKHWYAQHYRDLDYHTQIEAPRTHGRIDVLATRGHERIAIEIETGKSNIVHNVKQDLLASCTRVLIVATSKAAQQRVESQLGETGLLLPKVCIGLRETLAARKEQRTNLTT